jgi:hypothetical protein
MALSANGTQKERPETEKMASELPLPLSSAFNGTVIEKIVQVVTSKAFLAFI